MICYPTCAALILFTATLHNPRDEEVDLNVAWIERFVMFLRNFQDTEECDIKSLVDDCAKLYDIASFAQQYPADQETGYKDIAAGLWRHYIVGFNFTEGE